MVVAIQGSLTLLNGFHVVPQTTDKVCDNKQSPNGYIVINIVNKTACTSSHMNSFNFSGQV